MANIDDLLQQSIQAARQGDREGAKKLLSSAVRQDPRNPRAWYLLSQVVDQPDQVKFCLNKVLEIDPQHPKAQQKLAALNTGAGLEAVQMAPPPVYAAPSEPEFVPEPIQAAASDYQVPQVPGYTPSELPPAPPQIPYKREPIKRKKKTDLFSLWMILAVVAVLMVTCCCGTWFAITNNIGGIANQLNQSSGMDLPLVPGPVVPPASGTGLGSGQDLTIEVNGNYLSAFVSYTGPDQNNVTDVVNIPWVKTAHYPSGSTLMLATQGSGRGGNSITCVIKVDGKEVAHRNMKGTGRVVLCQYYVP